MGEGEGPPPEGDMAAPRRAGAACDERTAADAPIALRVEGLQAQGDRGTLAVHDLSLTCGPARSSASRACRAMASASWWRPWWDSARGWRADHGHGDRTPPDARRIGALKVRSLPEEPLRNACVGDMSVAENMALRDFDQPPLAWRLGAGAAHACAGGRAWIAEFSVKTQGEARRLAAFPAATCSARCWRANWPGTSLC